MRFEDKFVRESEAMKPEHKDKISIGNDTYAIMDALENIINKLEHIRLSSNK